MDCSTTLTCSGAGLTLVQLADLDLGVLIYSSRRAHKDGAGQRVSLFVSNVHAACHPVC